MKIIAPAGNLEKLKFAVLYGADEVYLGGELFNLRTQSKNFSLNDLEKAIDFAHQHQRKIVFLLNSFLHEKSIPEAEKFILSIKKLNFDALMVSDPGMLALLKKNQVKKNIHLSTQMNILNHLALHFWEEQGIDRIVLARETTLDEIKQIRPQVNLELEIFCHGALCIAYSGRCLLSRYLTGRNANEGDCSQSCRWNYSLIETKRPNNYLDIIEDNNSTEILSSKDLCLLERLEAYLEAGINSFKIEGRMKSLYYTANVTRVYKQAIHLAGSKDFKKFLPFWQKELDLVSHRPYTTDLFNEFDNLKFTKIPYIKKVLFMGYKISSGSQSEILFKAFNPVYPGDQLEAIFPIIDNVIKDKSYKVKKIYDEAGNEIEIARPAQTCLIKFDQPVDDQAIFRKMI